MANIQLKNLADNLKKVGLGFATAIVGGIVDALFLVYGGSVGSWIAYAADYADKWVGSSGLDGYIFEQKGVTQNVTTNNVIFRNDLLFYSNDYLFCIL